MRIDIQADAAVIWALLTNAADYPRWNRTVLSIEGDIAMGEKIKLRAAISPKRIFTPKVKEFEAGKRLVWGDAMGRREYLLQPGANGLTRLSMDEKNWRPAVPALCLYAAIVQQTVWAVCRRLKKRSRSHCQNRIIMYYPKP